MRGVDVRQLDIRQLEKPMTLPCLPSRHGWPILAAAFLGAALLAVPPAAAAAAPSLTGTPWRLASLAGIPLTDEQRAADATLILNRAGPGNGDGNRSLTNDADSSAGHDSSAGLGSSAGGEGQAVGSTGCNRFFARFQAHGDRLLFQQTGTTKMACEAVRMRLEQRFLDVLARSARRQQDGDRLVLVDSQGEELAAFDAGPPRR